MYSYSEEYLLSPLENICFKTIVRNKLWLESIWIFMGNRDWIDCLLCYLNKYFIWIFISRHKYVYYIYKRYIQWSCIDIRFLTDVDVSRFLENVLTIFDIMAIRTYLFVWVFLLIEMIFIQHDTFTIKYKYYKNHTQKN